MERNGDTDDWALLRRYADDRDEAAFARLVRRHADLVYSASLRRVGDRHLAEEITQAVFIVLARKARSLRGGDGAMSAWLLKCVRYAAANAVKVEARRRKYERAFAGHRSGVAACSSNPSDVLVWQEIAGELDDAVLRLSAGDREAILLRYFEGRPIDEIAGRLHLTDVAVRQRLSRAIERLRQRLTRRGAAMLSTADVGLLTGLLASHVVTPAPAGLAHASTAAATGVLTGAAALAAVSATGTSIAKGAMTMMAWTNAKLAAGIIGAVVVCGAGGIVAVRNADAADDKRPAIALAAAATAQDAPEPAAEAVAEKAAEDDDNGGAAVSLKKAPPVVVKTVPQSGAANVDPKTKEITVTYSKTMADGTWSWSTWGEDTFPKTTGKPRYKEDKRTCVLPVELQPGKTYAIWLNSENFGNFKDADGRAAVPYLLIFKTKK